MYKVPKIFKSLKSESYTPKLILLAYIPTIVIIIFTIININEKLAILKETKDLQARSYKIIAQFYELNYLQDERFHSLIYKLNSSEKNKKSLQNSHDIEYEFNNDKEFKNTINLMREKILFNQLSIENLCSYYKDIINKFIIKIIYEHKNKTNKKEFNNILNSYELIINLTENYYYQINILLKNIHNDNSKLLIQNLSNLTEQINLQKKYIIPNLPKELKNLFDKVLNNEIFNLLKKYEQTIKKEEKLNLTTEDIESLYINLKEQFYILSNFTASNIEDVSQKFYVEEFSELLLLGLLSLITILFLQIFGVRLKNLIVSNIDKSIKEISDKNHEIEELHKYINKYIILSKTDLRGNITYVSQAFCNISKYSEIELIGRPHNVVRHPDISKEVFKEVWKTIQSGEIWKGEIKNRAKDGSSYWTKSTIGPSYDSNNNIIGYTSIRQDISQQKYAEYLHYQVTNLLDNANNGFLSFGIDMKVKEGYSKISLDILSQVELKNKKVSDVLFENNLEKKEIFELGMEKIIEADNDLTKDILLTLLPEENSIKNKIFSIKYKILKNQEFMIILEDITEKRKLLEKIENENRIQKMIVAIATRKNEFIELKNSFFDFLQDISTNTILEQLIEDSFSSIIKSLHTYKGLFAQEELVNTTQALHELESEIIDLKMKNQLTNKSLESILKRDSLKNAFMKDLDLITSILGADFLELSKNIKIDANKFKEYESRVVSLFENNSNMNINNMKILLKEFLDLNQKSLKTLLSIYPQRVDNIAQRLNKKINPVKIMGDENITVRSSYEEFIKNLVHVFRNIIDHGVESPQERVNLNKYEKATIICQFKLLENGFIKLIISDDGRGIDPEIIKKKILEKKILSKEILSNMTKDEILNLIFKENFSTKENSDLLSGRGVGLSSLHNQLEKIGGHVVVESEVNIGSKFIFYFPAHLNNLKIDDKQITKIGKIFTDKIVNFLSQNEEISIEEKRVVNKFDFYDYYSTIKLSNEKYELFSIISFNKNLLDKILKIYTQSELNNEEKLSMYQSISDEVLNTVLGSCLNEFTKSFGDVKLFPPITLDKEILENFISNNESICICNNTNVGYYDNSLILIKKDN